MTETERLQLFNSTKDLVPFYINGKWYTKFMDIEDLTQEGYAILWRCTETYDSSVGVAFSTYVYRQLFYHLSNYVNGYNLGSPYGATYEEAISAALYAYREDKDIHEVCKERKLSHMQTNVAYLLSYGKSAFVSLHTPLTDDADTELQEVLASDFNLEDEVCSRLNDEDILNKVYKDFVPYYNSKHKSINPELNSRLLMDFLNNIFYERKSYDQIATECGVSVPVVRVRFEKFRKALRQWAPKACGLRQQLTH